MDVTEGFVYTNDQDRFDACEEAVNAVVKKVKRVWQVWKVGQTVSWPRLRSLIAFIRGFFHTVVIWPP